MTTIYKAEPQSMTFSIPSQFQVGQTSGNITCIDPFTARFQLNPPLNVSDHSVIELHQASFPYTQPNIASLADAVPNISTGNNRISINYGGAGWVDYPISTGLYTFSDIEFALNQIAFNAGWITSPTGLFVLQGIIATQQIIFTINPSVLVGGIFPVGNFAVSFANPSLEPPGTAMNSMGPVLGFPTSGAGSLITGVAGSSSVVTTIAPNISNFANVSGYLLYVSIVNSSYLNGSSTKLLYAFPLGNSEPNSVIAYQASLRLPVSCNNSTFSFIDVYTTDQSGNRLPLKFYQAPFEFSVLISKTKQDGSV